MPYGFGSILSRHMYNNVVNKKIAIPDFTCMVGTAERLAPLPYSIPSIKRDELPVIDLTKNMSVDDIGGTLDAQPLTEDDFKNGNSGWYGGAWYGD